LASTKPKQPSISKSKPKHFKLFSSISMKFKKQAYIKLKSKQQSQTLVIATLVLVDSLIASSLRRFVASSLYLGLINPKHLISAWIFWSRSWRS
jgi:hypothetical protein